MDLQTLHKRTGIGKRKLRSCVDHHLVPELNIDRYNCPIKPKRRQRRHLPGSRRLFGRRVRISGPFHSALRRG